jgi:hypothetical protein
MFLKRRRLRAPQSRLSRGLTLLLAVLLLGGCAAYFLPGPGRSSSPRSISLSALARHIKNRDIVELRVGDGNGQATTTSGEVVSFTTQRGESILKVLTDLGGTPEQLSRITYTVADPPPFWLGAAFGALPLVLFIAGAGRDTALRQSRNELNAVVRP